MSYLKYLFVSAQEIVEEDFSLLIGLSVATVVFLAVTLTSIKILRRKGNSNSMYTMTNINGKSSEWSNPHYVMILIAINPINVLHAQRDKKRKPLEALIALNKKVTLGPPIIEQRKPSFSTCHPFCFQILLTYFTTRRPLPLSDKPFFSRRHALVTLRDFSQWMENCIPRIRCNLLKLFIKLTAKEFNGKPA